MTALAQAPRRGDQVAPGKLVNMYKILSFPADGLMLTKHPRWGEQLWALCKLTKAHKNDNCVDCNLPVGNLAFRPMTNKGNRYHRICQRHTPGKVPA